MYLFAPEAPTVRQTRRQLYAGIPTTEAVGAGSLVGAGVGIGAGDVRLSARFDLPGVDVLPDTNTGGYALRFDAGMYDPQVAGMVAAAVLGRETFTPASQSMSPSRMFGPRPGALSTGMPAVRRGALNPPTPEELRAIQDGHAEGEATADELRVVERWDTNNAPDRWGTLRFTSAALAKLAADFSEGRSRLLFHDTTKVVGRIFAAEVVTESREGITAEFIRTLTYHHVRPSNQDMLDDLRLGVLAYDSIGFQGGTWTWKDEEVEAGGDRVRRSWIEIDHSDDAGAFPLVALESSYVYLGRMQGAGNAKLSPTPADADGTSGTVTDDEAPTLHMSL